MTSFQGGQRTPTLSEVIRTGIDARLLDVHTSLPGKIVSFDPARQLADVQPLTKRVLIDEDGNELVETLPVLPEVPVKFPRASGAFFSFPVHVGDFCLLIFNEASVDEFSANNGLPYAPGDLRRFSLSDAVALLGFYPVTRALAPTDYDSNDIVLGFENGTKIYIQPGPSGLVNIGSKTASDFVALAQKMRTEIQTIVDAIKNAATGSQDGGAAFKANIVAALHDPVLSVAATKTKAD